MAARSVSGAVRRGISRQRHRAGSIARAQRGRSREDRCPARSSQNHAQSNRRPQAAGTAAAGPDCACRTRRGRVAPADRHVLRSGRFDAAGAAVGSRGSARDDRCLSSLRHRHGRPVLGICRQVYGRRGADLFRLSRGTRGRCRAGGARRASGHRCGRPARDTGTAECAARRRQRARCGR